MNEWNKLSMKDRAAYIKLGIDSSITDLATIRDTYNQYAEGGYYDNKTIEVTLPEIVVTPSEVQKEYKLKVRPFLDKKAALDIGKSFDQLPKQYFDSRMKAFIDIHEYAGKPHLKGIQNPILPITTNSGKPRAYYNPVFNTAYNINSLRDAMEEMSHPIQLKLSKKPTAEIFDYVKDVVTGKQLESYNKKGSLEYNTHRIVQPLLNKYLLQKYRKGNHNIGTLEDLLTQGYNKFAEGGSTKWTMQDETNYQSWKDKLPNNLKYTDESEYDLRGAYKAGMEPQWNNKDKSYHLGSRDPYSGKILKSPHHPTYLEALITDASMGYYPSIDNKGNTYTNTWRGNKFGDGGSENNNFPQYIPEGYTYNSGEINQAPTTTQRIINKTKDVGRAVAAFVPFLGTVLDYYDDNMQQIPTGTIGDMGDVLRYSSSKIGTKADKMTTTKINTRKRGSIRSSLLHNTNKNVGTNIGKIGPKLAKNLGIVGMAIDTPNFVSDLENLKRALGLNYNEGLILK